MATQKQKQTNCQSNKKKNKPPDFSITFFRNVPPFFDLTSHQLQVIIPLIPLIHFIPVFTCVGALAILGRLNEVDADLLGWWLCERQLPSGGLNGRPEKLADVCYSWWVLSSLAIIGRLHWISGEKLIEFILSCQVRSSDLYIYIQEQDHLTNPFCECENFRNRMTKTGA